MTDWLSPLMRADVPGARPAILAILLSFGLAQLISGAYIWTFRGLSYSRAFVQSLALVSIVVCALMLAIGNNIAAGIGVAGGLSIVRFRTSLRDPRDIVFVFAALSAGISSGLQAFAPAIAGVLVFLAATVMLHLTEYGSRREFDGLVRFQAPPGATTEDAILTALKQNSRNFVLVTLRSVAQGSLMEHAYQLSLPNIEKRSALVRMLQSIDGVRDVSLMMQEPTLEL